MTQRYVKQLARLMVGAALSLGLAACVQNGIGGSGEYSHDGKSTVRFIHLFDADRYDDEKRDVEVFGPYLSARLAAAEQDYAKAANLYQEVLKRHPTSATILGRAFMNALSAGRRNDAVRLAERVVATKESAGISRFVIAADAIKKGNYDYALFQSTLGNDVEAHGGDDASAQDADDGNGILMEPFVLAWAHAGNGDADAAIAQLQPLSVEAGSTFFNGLAYYHMGLILSYLGEQGAEENFARAIDRFGGSLRMARAYAHHIAKTKSVDEAEAFLTTFGARYGIQDLANEEIAKLRDAKSVSLVINKPIEGVTEAVYLAAASLVADQRFGPAMLYLNLTLFCDETHDVALMMVGEIESFAENQQAAVNAYLMVPETSSNYVEARIKAAYALSDLDRTDDVIELLEDLLASDAVKSADPLVADEVYVAKAGMHRANEDFGRAYEIYNDLLTRVIARDVPMQSYWSLYYMRGMCLERLGRWDEAEKDLIEALDLNPGSALVMNYLGYSWIDQGIHLIEGRKLIEQAVAKRPRDGFIVDSLGWVQYKLGEYDEAAETLEKAVGLEPSDPTIADHYGDALWRAGHKIEARFQWRHALELNPSDELRLKLDRKLSFGLDFVEQADAASDNDG